MDQSIYQRNNLFLLLGRFISVLGTGVFDFALSLYVLDITGSAGMFSFVLGISILPQGLVNMLGGVFVDKYNKRKIMMFTELVSALIIFAFICIFSFANANLVLIIILVVLLNATQGLYYLAALADIPNIVGDELTTNANSAFQSIGAFSNIFGPVIGAVVYKSMGMNAIFWLDAASFIIGSIGVIALKYDVKKLIVEGSYIENLKVVFQYINKEKIIRFMLFLAVVFNFLYLPLLNMVLPYITYNVIKISAFQVSLVRSAAAIGVIIGSILVTIINRNKLFLKNFFVLLGIQSVLIILWVFPNIDAIAKHLNPLWITVVFVTLLLSYGILNTVQNLPMIVFFQQQLPEELRARVFGTLNTALLLSSPLGMWLFGIALQKMHWTIIPVASGIIMLVMCLIFSQYKNFKKFVKEL
jgi:DHA3 family macrolide efflux protein-like MFS transporter